MHLDTLQTDANVSRSAHKVADHTICILRSVRGHEYQRQTHSEPKHSHNYEECSKVIEHVDNHIDEWT